MRTAELASSVTRLDPRTGMGSCPFHPPDRHPSFGVNRQEGWWICFHGADGSGRQPLGGDAFELYCRLHGLTHREGLARLGGCWAEEVVAKPSRSVCLTGRQAP